MHLRPALLTVAFLAALTAQPRTADAQHIVGVRDVRASAPAAGAVQFPETARDTVDATVAAFLTEQRIPGAAVAIVNDLRREKTDCHTGREWQSVFAATVCGRLTAIRAPR